MAASSVHQPASPTRSPVDLLLLERELGTETIQTWDAIAPDMQTRIQQSVAPDQSRITGLVQPNTTADLARVIEIAHQHQWRVLPCGSGSKLDWGGLVQDCDLVVSTAGLNRLIDHAVGDLTVTVEAGMPFAQLQSLLAQAGQFLPIDPAFPEQATIGGILATADTGSSRHRYNSVRDLVLGVSVVRADGQVAKAGGRVVKNVAGYDLMKLLTGSFGTLAILTQVTVRVYPLPPASGTIALVGTGAAIAQASATLLSSALTPSAIELLSPAVIHHLGLGEGTGLLVRFQSIAPSVQQQADRLAEVAQAIGLTYHSYQDEEEATLWQRLQEQMSPTHREPAITCKIGVSPSEASSVVQQLEALFGDRGFAQIHLGSGLGRLVVADPTLTPAQLQTMRAVCERAKGFLSVLQAPVAFKQAIDVWGYSGNAIDLMRRLKHQFDPNALLSPGRFVGGI